MCSDAACAWQVVGGQPEHAEAARALLAAHEPSITAALRSPLQELPSVYTTFDTMLQDHERGADDGTYPRPPKIVAGASPPRLATSEPQDGESADVQTTQAQAASSSGASSGGASSGGQVLVSFSVVCGTTQMHESVGMIGRCPELGAWLTPVPMSPDEWPTWKLEVPMRLGERKGERKGGRERGRGGGKVEY